MSSKHSRLFFPFFIQYCTGGTKKTPPVSILRARSSKLFLSSCGCTQHVLFSEVQELHQGLMWCEQASYTSALPPPHLPNEKGKQLSAPALRIDADLTLSSCGRARHVCANEAKRAKLGLNMKPADFSCRIHRSHGRGWVGGSWFFQRWRFISQLTCNVTRRRRCGTRGRVFTLKPRSARQLASGFMACLPSGGHRSAAPHDVSAHFT